MCSLHRQHRTNHNRTDTGPSIEIPALEVSERCRRPATRTRMRCTAPGVAVAKRAVSVGRGVGFCSSWWHHTKHLLYYPKGEPRLFVRHL